MEWGTFARALRVTPDRAARRWQGAITKSGDRLPSVVLTNPQSLLLRADEVIQ
jgi:hypothetical protein